MRHGTATYAHTADGERSHRIVGTDTTRYAYDALGSLVQVVLPGADTVRYRHDGLGRRVERRQRDTATRRWLYGDAIPPVAELDSTDAVVARYVYGTLGHAPDVMLTPAAGYRVVSDHLGSVRMLVDTLSGEVVRHVERTAWGEATLDTGSVATSLGYAGGLTDSATKLVRFGARDHDPATGRWTCKDPIGFAGGDANLYAYAGNVPSSATDPSGLYYVYSQSTGTLVWVPPFGVTPIPVGAGYSGSGSGLNNPALESVRNVGPIPAGVYDIGDLGRSRRTGRDVMPLLPRPENEMYDRTAFQIHGDNSRFNQSASRGCIILPRHIRRLIGTGTDRELRVVP